MFRIALASLFAATALAACTPAAPAPTASAAPAIPTSTAAATAAAIPIETPSAGRTGAFGFSPKKRSVWETTAGPDQLRGNCPNGSVVPPYGPVLITPRDDGGFDWKDVQNGTYAFTTTDDGRFVYSGPNGRRDGAITMTLTFANDSKFAMQAEYVRTNAPGCIHIYEYAGAYKFDR
ncbi:MAG: hypothetical protein NTZ50_08055 [Chloroflexi bacterium]|nr:hypothetical protein [Chloroflexota bacterium]